MYDKFDDYLEMVIQFRVSSGHVLLVQLAFYMYYI